MEVESESNEDWIGAAHLHPPLLVPCANQAALFQPHKLVLDVRHHRNPALYL